MSAQDRKDPPLDPLASAVHASIESPSERANRKAKESANLDQALGETFPSSDPISPFVPAKTPVDAKTAAPNPKAKCQRAGCECEIDAADYWCSDACRDAQQGYAPSPDGRCPCGHAHCAQARQAVAA